MVVALMNQKGGSGKTSAAVNLAAAIGERRKRALVIDLDPQASATLWLGADPRPGLLGVLEGAGRLEALVVKASAPNVDLVPAGRELEVAGLRLRPFEAMRALRSALASLPTSWDVVLVDCPPTLGTLSGSALAAADAVLVPVEASALALAGLAALEETLDEAREAGNPRLALVGVLACRVDGRTFHARDVLEALRERFGKRLFKAAIRETVRMRESPMHRQPVTLSAPRSTAAADYRAAAAELLRRLERLK
jgi:chromosome partitioning protein